MFFRKELIRNKNGYTLVLHLKKQDSEFAEEIFEKLGIKDKKLSKTSLEYIRKYISENYHGIKINTVKVMLGTILVASIGYTAMNAANKVSTPVKDQESVQVNTENTVKPVETDDIEQKTEIPAPDLTSKDTLVLVNKNNEISSDYVPDSLVTPDVPFQNKSKIKMTPEAAKALEALFQKAKEDNIRLTAMSGYRSYEHQNEVFTANIKKYKSVTAANRFSAKPGQSEHQTGLAMDISSPSVNYKLTQNFAQTKEGKWLKENAPKFGFIVRFPKGKEDITGYQYEPWHVRYVGEEAAKDISEKNITLEEYLNMHKI
jgi:LAS superfamily LD-carboxypeptidase LdcB